MKLLSFILLLSFFLIACGPSKEEQERQRQIEDSLSKIDRENVLENVNNYFESDTLSTVKNENE
jgi:thioredoxin-related protein